MKKAVVEESIKITSLEFENLKRVEEVHLEVGDALTVIGGNNGQGKSSILDGIKWCLGGDRFKPSKPVKDGAEKADAKVILSNGWIVERYGKNGSLRVTTKDGRMGGQQLLKEFIGQFALDLQSFMDMTDKEKAKELLKLIGVDLTELDELERTKYQERTEAGANAKRLKAYADGLTKHPDAPAEEVSVGDLTTKVQAGLTHNQAGQRAQQLADDMLVAIGGMESEVKELEAQLKKAKEDLTAMVERKKVLDAEVKAFKPVDISALQQQMAEADTLNRMVRDNQKYESAQMEAAVAADAHAALEVEISEIREARMSMLSEAKMPLEGLGIEDEKLTYKGQFWDNMSHSEQLRVATAISSALNPKCGFVLIDKIEAMDIPTLKAFGKYCSEVNLQAITTRVSTGAECSFIIEGGKVKA